MLREVDDVIAEALKGYVISLPITVHVEALELFNWCWMLSPGNGMQSKLWIR